MATIVPFQSGQFERDLLISSFAPIVWLALVQARQIDEGRVDTVAVRWLRDLAEAVGPLLRDSDPEAIQQARLYAEQAIAEMRQQPPWRAS